MNASAKPELEQLIETFRAVTGEDVTEPLLADIDRNCNALSNPDPT